MSEITAIGRSNLEYYVPFLSEGLYDDLEDEDLLWLYGIESDEGMAIGAAAVRQIGTWAEITWFAIGEEFRGAGNGQSAFLQLLYELKMLGMERVVVHLPVNADPKLYRLFEGCSPHITDQDECSCITRIGTLDRLSFLKHSKKNALPLSLLKDRDLKLLGEKLALYHMDYMPLPIKKEDYFAKASSVYMEHGKPRAVLLLKKQKKRIHIVFMASFSKNPLAIMELLCQTMEVLRDYPKNTVVTMNLADQRMVNLMRYFFRDIEDAYVKILPVRRCEISLNDRKFR